MTFSHLLNNKSTLFIGKIKLKVTQFRIEIYKELDNIEKLNISNKNTIDIELTLKSSKFLKYFGGVGIY